MLLKLNRTHRGTGVVLIGTESIIEAENIITEHGIKYTKIRSREAMVTTNYVIETVEEIYAMYEKHENIKD